MDITPEAAQAMFYGFSTAWQKGLDEVKPWADRISTQMPSNGEREVYAFRSQMPRMRKWQSERVVERIAAHSYAIVNDDYESTVAVPRNKIEDDSFGIFTLDFQGAGSMAAKWPDDMLAQVLLNAESLVCFDGQPYFDDEHPVDPYDAGKGLYSNLLTGKPLTAENYAFARRAMRLFKNDNGRYANVSPNLLVVPPQLEDVAKTILQTDLIAMATLAGQNQVGAVNNIYRNTAEIVVIEELGDDATSWYLLDCTRPIRPFVHQIRKAVQFQMMFAPNDPNLFFLKELIFGADSRGAAGVTLPILAMKCKA